MAQPNEAQPYGPGDEPDAPIEVFFGSPTLDLGITTVPKIFPRFWTYLVSDGERLNDRQFALLMQVLLLRDSQDFELRVANLPMASKPITLERDKKVLRRLGLVFTQRLYYPGSSCKAPVMRAQRWDLRSLFYNLELISQIWKTRQRELTAEWELNSHKGNKPIYSFPESFAHEVVLPGDVSMAIIRGVFYPVPAKWEQRAQALFAGLRTGLITSGTQKPTEPETSGRERTGRITSGTCTGPKKSGTAPTRLETSGHLLDEEDDEEEAATLTEKILAYFAHRKQDDGYQPSIKERRALAKLLADGFDEAQIIAGVDEAFSRPSKPRHFTHCAAITRDLARTEQETPLPENRTQPVSQDVEALQETETIVSEAPMLIETDLSRAVEIYRAAGRVITPDILARFRLMAGRCDAIARESKSNGFDWLADALTAGLGVAKPGNLLNYADAVLNDWITNGRHPKTSQTPTRRKAKPSQKGGESSVHQGIRDYLEKHGGVLDGE
jgi:hypothetical protein